MASTAEEIARLRGTRPASLKDLLVDASFSRLWRAMLVSSLGDWVGFVAVAALGARIGGGGLGGPGGGGGVAGPGVAAGGFCPPARALGGPVGPPQGGVGAGGAPGGPGAPP